VILFGRDIGNVGWP